MSCTSTSSESNCCKNCRPDQICQSDVACSQRKQNSFGILHEQVQLDHTLEHDECCDESLLSSVLSSDSFEEDPYTSYHGYSHVVSYERAISYDELMKAAKQCANGVRWKQSVAKWMYDAPTNVAQLRKDLLNGTYKLGKYSVFMLNDPKPRIISSTKFRDRIVQRSLCNNGLYYMFTRSMIYDNGACLRDKGLTFAADRLSCWLQRFYRHNGRSNKGYYLKLDIKKYFDSTPHEMLKKDVAKVVKEPNFRKHVFAIIDSFEDSRPYEEIKKDPFGRRGIGLGSQVSQLLQSLYLSSLDHMIKEKLKVKCYVRYMDDMIIIHEDKKYLKYIWTQIAEYLKTKGLQLNQKSKIGTLEQGVKFLKIIFRLSKTGKVKRRLIKKSISKELRRARKLLNMLYQGQLTPTEIQQHFNTWYGCNKKRMAPRQVKIVNRHICKISSANNKVLKRKNLEKQLERQTSNEDCQPERI